MRTAISHVAHGVRARSRRAPLALTAVAFFLAFWQRPHEAFSDTRIELVTDPGLFLERAAQLWTPTIDLGHIQSSQFVGYLFPMGPFFWLGNAVGLPSWIVQRLWIGGLLAIAAWGVVRLLDRLWEPRNEAGRFVAGLLYIATPFVMITLNRGTSWLLPCAMLPWLLLWTHRGMHEPTGWRAPAAIALLLTAAGGGLNAALVAWLLLAVVLLMVYEAMVATGGRALWSFAWRASLCALGASLWWLVPVAAQVRYGADYLTYTEHAEAILHTPSASESLRLLGYWVAYINGYPDSSPQVPAITTYLLSAPTILATYAVPLLAVATLGILRRWRYAAFFALLLGVAVIAMALGFPMTNLLGRAVTDAYYHAGPLVFMRTTYKAAPLAALALACLGGVGAGALFELLRTGTLRISGVAVPGWLPRAALAVALAALIGLWGRPLWAGNAVDARLFFSKIPSAWTRAVDDAQTTTPPDTRIAVLPGELFAWYRWGGLQNAIAPAISRRPVLIRQITRPATTNAAQLLDSVDGALQQGRLVPGQLPPLLQLMGVGRVLVGTDSSPVRNEALNPALAARELATQPGFGAPAAVFGPVRTFGPPADRSGPTVRLPEVRAYAAPRPAQPAIKRAHPAAQPQVVDGDADGLVSMAATGTLDPRRASFYAGDLTRAALAPLLRDDAQLVFTDSNRRRVVLTSKIRVNIGPTLGAHDPIARVFPQYEPFPGRDQRSQTVAVYSGLSSLWQPLSNAFTIFPEHRPYAAFDDDPTTSWIAQADERSRQYLMATLAHPKDVAAIEVVPHRDANGITVALGVEVNGGAERIVRLRPGPNRVVLNAHPLRTLRLRPITPPQSIVSGGLDTVRIPGLRVREALRLPTDLAAMAAGQDLRRSAMSIVLDRVTADFPGHAGTPSGPANLGDPVDMTDAEPGMRRIVTLPAARRFTAAGWASVSPSAADDALDRLVGMPGSSRYSSSGRWEGMAGYRASSAFDGDPTTGWADEYARQRLPWVQWQGDRAIDVRTVRLVPLAGPTFLRPLSVTVATPLGGFELTVPPSGVVRLPRTVRTRSLRITVRKVHTLTSRQLRSAHVPRAVGFREIEVAGLPRARPARTGTFTSACGSLRAFADGGGLRLRVFGSITALNNGTAVHARTCGAPDSLALRAGANLLVLPPEPLFRPDHIALTSAAPAGPPAPAAPARVDPNGDVHLAGPGWLALGESYSKGWRAFCRDARGDEHDLGAPQEIDGYANGWRIDGATCRHARFVFAPQAAANVAYAVSAVALLALVVLLALVAWRRRRRPDAVLPPAAPPPPRSLLALTVAGAPVATFDGPPLASAPSPPAARLRPGWIGSGVATALVGAIVALVGSPIAGAVALLPTLVFVRLGVSAGRLYGLAALAVAATGALYLLTPESVLVGVNFDFSLHHMAAHWCALAAMGALVLGGLLQLGDRRRARRVRSG